MENEENIENVEITTIPIEENQTDLLDNEENSQDDMVEDVPSAFADYYGDYYYSQVLTKLSNLESCQNTIINNQDIVIEKLEDGNSFLSCSIFLVAILFIYIFIKDLLGHK